MAKVLVLYYSSFGHIETMAHAVAEGARAAGATADVKRVPENVPEEIAKASYFKLDQSAPIAKVEELANYDAIVVGAPTRFGRMPSAMGSFWEQAGQLWMSGALLGKVGGAFTSSATQHGGNETTLFSIIANLMHFGLIIVGLPYSHAGQRHARRDRRRRALRRNDDRRRAGSAPADEDRTRRRAASGRTDRQGRRQALGLVPARRGKLLPFRQPTERRRQ